jgi:endonuclease/exonuclease/phosphatase family metal-dependent hydrolase
LQLVTEFSLISWNLARWRSKLAAQIELISRLAPGIACFQEVIQGTRAKLIDSLRSAGLRHVADSFELAPDPSVLKGKRQYGEIIASRWSLEALAPDSFGVRWPERVLSAIIASPYGPIEVHTAHIPPGSTNGWIKVEQLEGIFERLARPSTTHRILCGDFNTPKSEGLDGVIETWGGKRGERWVNAELNVLSGLASHDLADVYRGLKGYGEENFSFCSRGNWRRYDHVFASRSLRPISCEYVRQAIIDRLSDHAPIVVKFLPREQSL